MKSETRTHRIDVNGVTLHAEEAGAGQPIVFVHEFAGDSRSFEAQVRFFSRRYRCITYNARGYPPSDVPESLEAYSQELAVADLKAVMDHFALEQAHVLGFSMGGFAALMFTLAYPQRVRSAVLAGTGYGSTADRSAFEKDANALADRIEKDGMEKVADMYSQAPARLRFRDKDIRGWTEFRQMLRESSTTGHALTMRGVQARRPSVLSLGEQMKKTDRPVLIITGDEDEPCLEPGFFMKRVFPAAALVVMANTGHTLNLEEPDAFNRHVDDFFHQVDAGRWMPRDPGSLGESALFPDEER